MKTLASLQNRLSHFSSSHLLVIFTCAILLLSFVNPSLLSYIDRKWNDTLMANRNRPLPQSPVFIAAIDHKAVDRYGRWPWSRSRMAEVVNVLSEHYQVSQIGIDVIFSETQDNELNALRGLQQELNKASGITPEIREVFQKKLHDHNHDNHLAQALKSAGNVVLGYFFIPGKADSVPSHPALNQEELQWLAESLPVTGELPATPSQAHGQLEAAASQHDRLPLLEKIAQLSPDAFQQLLNQAIQLRAKALIQPSAIKLYDGKADPEQTWVQHAAAIEAAIPLIAHAAFEQGYLNVVPNREDGVIREIHLLFEHGGRLYPSFDLLLYQHWLGADQLKVVVDKAGGVQWIEAGENWIPSSPVGSLYLNFKGPRGTFENVSIADLLDRKVPVEQLRGRIALIGITEVGLQDLYASPTSVDFPGIEVHATVLDNLITNSYLRELPEAQIISVVVWFLLGMLISRIFPRLPFAVTFLWSLSLSLSALMVHYLITFNLHLRVSMIYPQLLFWGAWLLHLLKSFLGAQLEKKALQRLLADTLKHAPVAILTTNPKGEVIQDNAAAQRLFHNEFPNSLLRRNLFVESSPLWSSFSKENPLPQLFLQPEKTLRHNHVPFVTDNGQSLMVNVHLACLHQNDEVQGAILQIEDVTDLAESRRKIQSLNDVFQRFVPSQFLDRIARYGLETIRLGIAEMASVSILFSDIRSFTSLAESMTHVDVFRFLNEFLSRMEPEVQKQGGYIDKFIGDAIMALFDENQNEDAFGASAAVRAAVGMRIELDRYNQERKQNKQPPIAIGIGIHCGNVTMGTLGSQSRMDSTVIGDSVNTASRIEGLTKTFRSSIIVSDKVVQSLPGNHPHFLREVGTVKVKGKKQPTKIFEVYDYLPETQREQRHQTQAQLTKNLEAFYQADWKTAVRGFARLAQQSPEDPIPQIYREWCKQFQHRSLEDGWDGTVQMTEK